MPRQPAFSGLLDAMKKKLTRRELCLAEMDAVVPWGWAKRGTRPSAPHDQRTISAHIFGAICPTLGKGAGLVLPVCNTDAPLGRSLCDRLSGNG